MALDLLFISPSAFAPLSLSARSQVAELLQERAGVSIEKKHITAPDLKHVGRGTCTIQLHKDVTCKFELEIVAA